MHGPMKVENKDQIYKEKPVAIVYSFTPKSLRILRESLQYIMVGINRNLTIYFSELHVSSIDRFYIPNSLACNIISSEPFRILQNLSTTGYTTIKVSQHTRIYKVFVDTKLRA